MDDASALRHRTRRLPTEALLECRALRNAGASNGAHAGAAVLDRSHRPRLYLEHPVLERRFDTWEAIARVLTAAIANPQQLASAANATGR